MPGETWSDTHDEAGRPLGAGSLVLCPRCKGDGYREIGDVSYEGYTQAEAVSCPLCIENGDRAGHQPGWYTDIIDSTGRLALPIAPAVLALIDEEGEDHLTDLYNDPHPEQEALHVA